MTDGQKDNLRLARALDFDLNTITPFKAFMLYCAAMNDAVVADWKLSQPRAESGAVEATALDYVEQATPQERFELRQRIGG